MRKGTEQVILAAKEFVKACRGIEDEHDIELYLNECDLRFEDKTICLSGIECELNSEEIIKWADDATCTIQELVDEEYMDGAIICEGKLYEMLYYYEAGSIAYHGREITEELYKTLAKILANHGFSLNLSRTGTIQLQSKENISLQIKRDFGI